ncbi:MAG: dihydrofolate reductase family protein [Bacteroidetes bacterium]|nr:dihydrofolate reductase family protein [Bacteroidota bacterium]
MRKVILQMNTSMDGYVAGPNGELDWMLENSGEEGFKMAEKLLEESDLILLGRGMSKEFLDYWPKETSNFAKRINSLPKVIFSRTMKESDIVWDNVTISKDIAEKIKEEKAKPGKNIILYGGCGLATSFAKLGIVDDYYLSTVPVILGKGKHLFDGMDMKVLKLIESTPTPSGEIINHYEPKK